MEVLAQDKRVFDYCGFDLKPGYMIYQDLKDEETKKFTFKIKG